jgi:hypothetical protein
MSASTTAAAVCHFVLLDWGAASVVIFCSSRADTKEDELQVELYVMELLSAPTIRRSVPG